MAKIVVAFRDRSAGETIASMLKESGYEVIRICTSADEVRRAFQLIQDGILISGYRLTDRTLDQVLLDLDEGIEVLCIAKPEQFLQMDSQRIFRLSPPVKRSILSAWADMLIQLHYRNVPRRKEEDKDLILRAKQKLMREQKISEQEAHRYLQQQSMRIGLKMTQVAKHLLER